jgi:ATP-binding cassette subfamily C protein CydD
MTDSTGSRCGAVLHVLANVMWLPQAGALAVAVERLNTGGEVPDMLVPALVLVAGGAVRAILDAAGARLCYIQAQRILSALRCSAVTALMRCSPLDATRPSSGYAASVIAEQAQSILPYLIRFQATRLRAVIVPAVICLTVLPFSWIASLILLVTLPPVPVFSALIGWKTKAASEKQLAHLGTLNGFLLDRLRGLATIRALGAVELTAIRLRQRAETLRQRTMEVLKIAFLTSAMLELFSALGVALMAIYVGFHLLGQIPFGAWGETLSLGEGLFILLLAPAFFEPLRDLSAVWHDRASGQAAEKALMALNDRKMPLLIAAESTPVTLPHHDIHLNKVSFRHGETMILGPISLNVQAGERIALLGPSGAGKTTLLSLIAGLAPCEGDIRIGGVPMSPATAQSLREQMAWLGQKPYFFAGSVRSNISASQPVDVILGALARVGLEDIPSHRHIGEHGAGLSGGEALRLALARIAVRFSTCIILADEPTAHLDRSTARQITDQLFSLAHGKTLIVATHDAELAARMDRVIKLECFPKKV